MSKRSNHTALYDDSHLLIMRCLLCQCFPFHLSILPSILTTYPSFTSHFPMFLLRSENNVIVQLATPLLSSPRLISPQHLTHRLTNKVYVQKKKREDRRKKSICDFKLNRQRK